MGLTPVSANDRLGTSSSITMSGEARRGQHRHDHGVQLGARGAVISTRAAGSHSLWLG
jgi:hypothetical protein